MFKGLQFDKSGSATGYHLILWVNYGAIFAYAMLRDFEASAADNVSAFLTLGIMCLTSITGILCARRFEEENRAGSMLFVIIPAVFVILVEVNKAFF